MSRYSTTALTNGDVMSVTVDNGANTCATTSNTIATVVGKIPHSFFNWKSACGQNQITFHDLSSVAGNSTLTKWEWDYTNDATVDYSQVSALPDVIFNYPATNQYNARLRVTSNKGCYKDTVMRVYTLPGKTPTITNPYAVNFASSNQGWAYDGLNSSWGWGTAPAAFSSSRPIWSTGQASGDGKYYTAEHSYLYGPCIDLSMLDKPMLALKLSSKITDKPAGGILEASIDEGLNWIKVGNVDEGLGWYNVSGVVSTPFTYLANNTNNNPLAQGWATDTINFDNTKLSRISLQQFAGQTSVRLRINFAAVADVNAVRYAGIGIDSIWIGNRTKRVVMEHFTNTLDASQTKGIPIVNGEKAVNVIRDNRKKDVSAIYYHCSFPDASDRYNVFYPAGPSSRVLYYGVSNVPRTVLDGKFYNGSDYTNTNASLRLDTNDIDARALVPAIFKMDMSTYLSPGNVKAAVRMKYNVSNSTYASDVLLHVIVIEDSANNDINYSSVVRQMLPDAAGSYISKTWHYNDSMDIVQDWPNSLPTTSKFGVVSYIQNAGTKEILQSIYVKGQGTSGNVVSNANDPLSDNEILIFPNPADNEIMLLSSSEEVHIAGWALIDNLGRGVKNAQLESHLKGIAINTSDLENGIYMIQVLTSKGKNILKKIIIAH